MNLQQFQWTRQPKEYEIGEGQITITTEPHTDLWQRTYYHFRNDNAPLFQMETEEKFFSFIVKTDFTESHHRFDQCGIVLYLDSENWLKASVEVFRLGDDGDPGRCEGDVVPPQPAGR